MKGIIIKDILTIKKSFWQIALIYVVFSVVGIVTSQPSWAAIGIMMSSLIPIILIEIDENTNWLKYVTCTPIGKKKYILSKYVLETICVALGYGIVVVSLVISA